MTRLHVGSRWVHPNKGVTPDAELTRASGLLYSCNDLTGGHLKPLYTGETHGELLADDLI